MNAYNDIDDTQYNIDILYHLAKIADSAEQYKDVCNFMKQIIKKRQALTYKQRYLFAQAYKHLIIPLRRAYSTIIPSLNLISNNNKENPGNSEIKTQQSSQNTNNNNNNTSLLHQSIKDYQNNISNKIIIHCDEVIELCDILLKNALKNEISYRAQVFYIKLKADIYRYLCEIDSIDSNTTNNNNNAQICQELYLKAKNIATRHLDHIDIIYLSLALNYSVFCYEILDDVDQAHHIAKYAFDHAINELDSLNEDEYKDVTLILQLIRDNIILWQNK